MRYAEPWLGAGLHTGPAVVSGPPCSEHGAWDHLVLAPRTVWGCLKGTQMQLEGHLMAIELEVVVGCVAGVGKVIVEGTVVEVVVTGAVEVGCVQ